MKHVHNNAADSLKKAVEKRTVFQKERTKFFINGKNTVSVSALNQFKSHGIGTFLSIFDTTGRTKATFASESDKFHVSAGRAGIHDAAIGRVATMNHSIDVIQFDISGMKGILNLFIIVGKDFL